MADEETPQSPAETAAAPTATRWVEKILVGEEAHADWLEAQLSLIDQLGEPLNLSQQIRD